MQTPLKISQLDGTWIFQLAWVCVLGGGLPYPTSPHPPLFLLFLLLLPTSPHPTLTVPSTVDGLSNHTQEPKFSLVPLPLPILRFRSYLIFTVHLTGFAVTLEIVEAHFWVDCNITSGSDYVRRKDPC